MAGSKGADGLMKLRHTIVCVDVGFRATGVAVWDCARHRFTYTVVLSFPAFAERYVVLESARVARLLSTRLAAIIRAWQPKFVVAELPFGGARNARASACMALACGVAVATCSLCGVSLKGIRPQEVKKWAGGRGRKAVPKEVVIRAVTKRFGARLLPTSAKAEHVADAMACLGVWKDVYERH